jgi:hypothetical protein
VGAAVDTQLSHTRWQAFSTGFGGEFVCGLCAHIGGDVTHVDGCRVGRLGEAVQFAVGGGQGLCELFQFRPI